MTGIAFVGTGFVSDYYMTTLANHSGLKLIGVWDRDAARLSQFCAFYKTQPYACLDALLADPAVTIVVNLTSPDSHFEISLAALGAGKHVYSEKPLAMSVEEAEQLVALANDSQLTLCAAPANALSDAFDLTKSSLARGVIGKPRLVYAEMEDGPVFRTRWADWRSRSGAQWPGLHEFEVGCTLEHAGYGLSWLVGLFGSVAHVTAFSTLAFPDKGQGSDGLALGADFSVGCLRFTNGVTARLTCGLAAPRDRSLVIMGDSGMLTVRDLWDHRSPVELSTHDARSLPHKVASKIEHVRGKLLPVRFAEGRPITYDKRPAASHVPSFPSQIDFAGGIAAQASAIAVGRAPFFSGNVALHLTELALALHAGYPDYTPRTGAGITSQP